MSDAPVTAVIRCPGCGADIAFKIGSSRVLICQFCSFAVARTANGFENIGHIADVIPTGTRFSLGTRGTFSGRRFTLVGRIQLDWGQGRWDEWYAAFDDGRWGWLAEAAGHYYLSFHTGAHADKNDPAQLNPGDEVLLAGKARYVVSDRKQAKYVAARGELPEVIPLDVSFLSIDLSGHDNSFATFDYSDDVQRPTIYLGTEVSFESLAIDTATAEPIQAPRESGGALTCPKCHAPITIQVPDQAQRVTCIHCSALLDATQGNLRYLSQLAKAKFDWELGRHGTFFGLEYIVVGWVRRSCTVEGKTYYWEEYLLYDPKNACYRFLVNSDHHWSFVTPIAAGDVAASGRKVTYKQKSFRRFASVEATVESVYGEFYWAVAKGEKVTATDYIAPPEGLSEETGQDEVNWSHARYLPRREIMKAFNVTQGVVEPSSVGSMQPNPVDYGSIKLVRNVSLVVAFGLYFFFRIYAGNTVIFNSDLALAAPERPPVEASVDGGSVEVADDAMTDEGVTDEGATDDGATDQSGTPTITLEDVVPTTHPEDVDAGTPDNSPYQSVVLVTDPLEITREHRNLMVEFEASVTDNWIGLNAELINVDTYETYEVDLESSYYRDDDSSTDERYQYAYLSEVPAGHYVMRAELDWDKGVKRPFVSLKLTSGVPRLRHFFGVLFALLLVPFISWRSFRSFETRRWEDATEDE